MSFQRFCDQCGQRIVPEHVSGDTEFAIVVTMMTYDQNSRPTTNDAHVDCAKLLIPKLHRALMDDSIVRVELKKERVYS